jgi:[phosphatase 2A protein]-leucine-carboxy methyltransferase
LKTLSAYPTLQKQILRLKDCGFASGQDAIDINFAHDGWMGKDELGRIAKLELLDEIEEWQLLAAHYCITWGWRIRGDRDTSHGSVFDEWGNITNTLA